MFYLNGEVRLGVRFVEKKPKAEKQAKNRKIRDMSAHLPHFNDIFCFF